VLIFRDEESTEETSEEERPAEEELEDEETTEEKLVEEGLEEEIVDYCLSVFSEIGGRPNGRRSPLERIILPSANAVTRRW
tara:strand:- start:136 stop:378 length:243 start_codon:yes stop_codon:yes gene_type:complete